MQTLGKNLPAFGQIHWEHLGKFFCLFGQAEAILLSKFFADLGKLRQFFWVFVKTDSSNSNYIDY